MYKFKRSIEEGTREVGKYYLEYTNTNEQITEKEEKKTEHEVAIAVLKQQVELFEDRLYTLQNSERLRVGILKKTLKNFGKRAAVGIGAVTALTCLTPLTVPFGVLAGITTLTLSAKRALKKYQVDIDPLEEIEQENVEESLVSKINSGKQKIGEHQDIIDLIDKEIVVLEEKRLTLRGFIMALCNELQALEANRQMAIEELLSNKLKEELDECYDVTYGEENPVATQSLTRGRTIEIGENI